MVEMEEKKDLSGRKGHNPLKRVLVIPSRIKLCSLVRKFS